MCKPCASLQLDGGGGGAAFDPETGKPTSQYNSLRRGQMRAEAAAPSPAPAPAPAPTAHREMAEGLMTSPQVAPTGVPAQQYGGGLDTSPPAPPTEQQAGQQAGQGRMKKRGKLWKQGQGGMLGRANWKEREFVLTANPTQLSYFDCGLNFLRKKGSLDFAGPAKVERLLHAQKTGTSGSTEWRFALTCGSRTLNMAANSEGEMHEWIDTLCEVLGQTSCTAPKAAASHGGEEGKELCTSEQMPTAAASGGGGGAAFDNNTPAEGSPPARLRALKGGSAGNMTEREMLSTS